jgi:DNA topoisomerase 6 subunit A-like protein
VGLDLRFNIITPYMPITSDGKAPNLSGCSSVISKVVGKAVRRALRAEPPEPKDKLSQKAVVLAYLESAIAKASGNGAYRFSPRQVFYVIRPIVRDTVGCDLQWGNFEAIIGDHELECGEIAGMYRDPRGTLYHPHVKDSIPLGTLQVERYQRPEWTFNKILFIEKEGFFEALKDDAWPERHDCALLTSKGQPTRAARDLLDLLGESGEEILFFAVHDADAAGTLIYQSLQEATRARPGRKVRVINLGLEPEEALGMGLEVEDVDAGERRKPVASYVLAEWRTWLRHHRVELNAMTTPQFIAWLDGKMAAFGNGKLVPPAAVLMEGLNDLLDDRLRQQITQEILREARIEERVAAALRRIALPAAEDLHRELGRALVDRPEASWRAALERTAAHLLTGQATP